MVGPGRWRGRKWHLGDAGANLQSCCYVNWKLVYLDFIGLFFTFLLTMFEFNVWNQEASNGVQGAEFRPPPGKDLLRCNTLALNNAMQRNALVLNSAIILLNNLTPCLVMPHMQLLSSLNIGSINAKCFLSINGILYKLTRVWICVNCQCIIICSFSRGIFNAMGWRW